jgi:hypothetical protein
MAVGAGHGGNFALVGITHHIGKATIYERFALIPQHQEHEVIAHFVDEALEVVYIHIAARPRHLPVARGTERAF